MVFTTEGFLEVAIEVAFEPTSSEDRSDALTECTTT